MIPGVTPITKKPHNGGTLHPASNLTYLSPPEQFLTGAKLFPGTSLIKKKMFPNMNLFGLCESAWGMTTHNGILKNEGISTKSLISQLLLAVDY